MDKNRFDKIKNIVLPAAVLCLGVGFFAVTRSGGQASADRDEGLRAESHEAEPAESLPQDDLRPESSAADAVSSDADTEPVWAEIPELSCPGIEFEEDSVIFALSGGGYAIIDREGALLDTLDINAEEGVVTVSCDKGTLRLSLGGETAEAFTYNGHLIEYRDGVLYQDKSPIEYKDTSFSAYSLNDEYNIECTSVGKYVLRKSDGSVTDHCVIKDDSGLRLDIYAGDNGFEAVDGDNLLEMVIKVNGDLLVTSWDLRLYVNGWELVPPGHDAVYSAKEEEPEDSSEEESSAGDGSSEEERPPYSNVSEVPLTPMKPAAKNGSVSTANEGVSEDTLELLGYVNEVRAQYGLGEVYGLAELDRVAEKRAEELAESYSHDRPDGSDYKTALDEAGISWWTCAENIASSGKRDARAAFEAWMSSEDHRSVILDPKAKYMAAGIFRTEENGTERYYWSQIFINDVYVPDK